MKVSVLASGSKGNCTFIDFGSFKALVDIGISYKNASARLSSIDLKGESIDYVFITHIHNDHTVGLKQFIKRTNVKVVLTNEMLNKLEISMPNERIFLIDDEIVIDDVVIKALKGSHDSGDINFYIFKKNNKEIAYVTDTGYINVKNFSNLSNKDLYLFESNHDIEMLMNGKYPHYLKQRVVSDEGHLSNDLATSYLCKFVGDKTRAIVLFHLSENNNSPDIALKTLKEGLISSNKTVDKVIISTYDCCTEVIEI